LLRAIRTPGFAFAFSCTVAGTRCHLEGDQPMTFIAYLANAPSALRPAWDERMVATVTVSTGLAIVALIAVVMGMA